MDQEQAERFLAAAQQDYTEAVERFIQCVPREEVVLRCDERADVLAAQQVLELAQREVEQSRRPAQHAVHSCIDEGGICDGCADLAPRLFLYGERYLCPSCGVQEENRVQR